MKKSYTQACESTIVHDVPWYTDACRMSIYFRRCAYSTTMQLKFGPLHFECAHARTSTHALPCTTLQTTFGGAFQTYQTIPKSTSTNPPWCLCLCPSTLQISEDIEMLAKCKKKKKKKKKNGLKHQLQCTPLLEAALSHFQ